MNTLALLQSDVSSPSVAPVIFAAITIAILGGALSVFVVLKRLAFIGQGVSHAAFGGVGIALVLGVHGATTMGAIGQLAIVIAFSILAALWISALTRISKGRTDTAIGVVLSASMALGFVLFTVSEGGHEHDDHGHAIEAHQDEHHIIEEILFGNILDTDWTKAGISIGFSLIVLMITWFMRRRFIFWAFDEPVCDAYGINSKRTTDIFLVLLALSVVMAMQITGVVLAAAILVLPGAAALNISNRLSNVFGYSILIAVIGAAIGMLIGFQADYPIGPAIVLTQSALYVVTLLMNKAMSRLR
ncbi:MAG: metal ABC transporter permease [Phycisphaerales bacterium]|nr:metal ABC transporter permease [Phycisphaerales bacterium]